ncbi:MAG: ATP-binding protein [Alphaproteobacteria bacterium]|nr:ATP-binding protein [Alphaproteobacteria bacterium]
MTDNNAALHLLCGKIASGKSTLASRLAVETGGIVVAEDPWLSALYPEELHGLEDYVRTSRRLRTAMTPHLIALLRQGMTVILDFAANTPKQRAWMAGLIRDSGVSHRLHLLDIPDDVCRDRLRQRNAEGSHDFQVSDAMFDEITRYFTPPTPDEGFEVILHRG